MWLFCILFKFSLWFHCFFTCSCAASNLTPIIAIWLRLYKVVFWGCKLALIFEIWILNYKCCTIQIFHYFTNEKTWKLLKWGNDWNYCLGIQNEVLYWSIKIIWSKWLEIFINKNINKKISVLEKVLHRIWKLKKPWLLTVFFGRDYWQRPD